jgi:hypothetical protein
LLDKLFHPCKRRGVFVCLSQDWYIRTEELQRQRDAGLSFAEELKKKLLKWRKSNFTSIGETKSTLFAWVGL